MEYFSKLVKPALEKFIKSPTKQNLNDLKNIIEGIEITQIRSLETYILAPLIIKLDQIPEEKTSDLKYEIVDCIKSVITKTRIKNINQLKTTLIITLKQIHDFQTGFLRKNLSEEIKLSVISCLSKIFHRTNNDVLEIFYTKENSNLIGKIAATCVDVLQNDKYKLLRISAVQCLQSLFYVHNEADFGDITLREQVADSTFYFLPKIVAVLNEIALNDEKIGKTIIILSIQTLTRILNVIYEDKIQSEWFQYSTNDFLQLISNKNVRPEESDELVLGTNIKTKSVEEKIKIIQEISRNQKWFEATSRKLKTIFLNLQILQSNESEEIRHEYGILVTTLFKKCNCNLNENIYVFLESIIALSQDDNPEIKNLCEKTLILIKNQSSILIEWEVLFNQHMIKLPRIITRNYELEQVTEFLFLKGFFKHIPEENLCTIFSFPNNVERFTNNFIEALDLKLYNDLLINEYCINSTAEELENLKSYQWKKFKNISTLKVVDLIRNICGYFGTLSVNLVIFNYLLDISKRNPLLSNEIFLFLTFMLANDANGLEKKERFLNLFLIELSDEKHWHLVLLPDELHNENNKNTSTWYVDRTPGLYESAYEVRTSDIDLDNNFKNDIVNRIDAQFNVLHTCIVLDSIGNCALAMEENFKHFVFKFLHRVLLKSNSTNSMIHRSGLFALNCIKKSLNYTDISSLIQHYSDYLSYHINSYIKKPQFSDLGIDILASVLQYSSLESFTYLENIFNTLLEEFSKTKLSSCTISYLKVFNNFLINIHKWISNFEEEINLKKGDEIVPNKNENLLTSLKSILNKQSMENNEEETNDEHKYNTDYENMEENKKSDVPKYIIIIVDILKKVLKYVSSKEQMHKIAALECMISGLPALKNYEDEILPLVHLLWYPYSERFKDSDPVILNRCFMLLEVLADCSKSFLQRRILKDVIPSLNEFLKATLPNSVTNKNITSTQEHKLQIKLLKGYAKIAIDLDIQLEYMEDITNIVILYLNTHQPQILQELAVAYLIEISKINKPLVYIKLLYYQNNSAFKNNIIKIANNINLTLT